MRTAALALLVIGGALIAAEAQTPVDARLQAQLKQLFPSAATFSPKEGEPPHFKAFVNDPRSGPQTLAGFAFWTTELEPLERGYDGPIKILVGMDTKGVLTGIIVPVVVKPGTNPLMGNQPGRGNPGGMQPGNQGGGGGSNGLQGYEGQPGNQGG